MRFSRAKAIDTKEWTYGVYALIKRHGTEAQYVIFPAVDHTDPDSAVLYDAPIVVDPLTKGDYVGLDLKDGTPIFEGDVVESVSWNEYFSNNGSPMEPFRRIMVVEFYEGAYCMKEPLFDDHSNWWQFRSDAGNYNSAHDLKILGNIFDNPELEPKPQILQSSQNFQV